MPDPSKWPRLVNPEYMPRWWFVISSVLPALLIWLFWKVLR